MIWGFKTEAIFDVWTFEHFLSGISIGTLAIRANLNVFKKRFNIDKDNIKTRYFDVVLVLFAAYLWETVEHYLEAGILGIAVEYWFQGVEYWANRIISDPTVTVLGYYVAKSNLKLVTPARILSLIWLIFHIVIFPHSMYLHTLM
jgi:hypothetical protein